jgi:hypothetical protein
LHWRACGLLVVAFTAFGCGDDGEVDPLDCEVADHLLPLSAETQPAAPVRFEAGWGKAPPRMKGRVLRGDDTQLALAGCGRDDVGLWELAARWYQLPEDEQVSTSVEFFDRARLDAGERLGDEPHFGGSLLRCWKGGCVAVDRYAFHYGYAVTQPDYVSGRADIELLDRAQGHFKATIVAQPGEPSPGPETRIDFDITWDPAAVPPPLGG